MKRKLVLIGVVGLLCATVLAGCGTSEEAKYVIDKINTIGDVDYEDELLIGECEDAYIALTDEQKAEVSNVDILAKAREKMDALLEAKPLPFSYANWESTQSKVIELMGRNADEEYDTDSGYHVLQFNNCEYDGYSGLTRYCFINGTLSQVLFITDEFNEEIYKHFNDSYMAKYGEPRFENSAGKVWYVSNANVGLSGTALFGGYINLSFNKPAEE